MGARLQPRRMARRLARHPGRPDRFATRARTLYALASPMDLRRGPPERAAS